VYLTINNKVDYMPLLKNLKILSLIIVSFALLNSCSKIPGADARKYDPDPKKRIQKNMEEGRGLKLFKKGNEGGVFDFASSNPLWRATLNTLDFMPILNASYSGGIIITDWYGQNNGEDSIKITVKFLSNEIRPDGIQVQVYKKNCKSFESCQSNLSSGKLNNELKLAILKKAAQIKKIDLTKKN